MRGLTGSGSCWRSTAAALVAGAQAWTMVAMAVPSVIVAVPQWATAQTLDLGGVPQGPPIAERNGAADLASAMEAEERELSVAAESLTGEARSGVRARARVRAVAAYLLRSGSIKPWDESAPAAAGARLAQLVGRVDAVVELAVAGRGLRDRTIGPAEAKRALRLLDAIADCPSDGMRRAMVAPAERLPEEIARALGSMLAPLAELATLIEGPQNDDPWPVIIDARASNPDRAARTPTSAEIGRSIEALPAGAVRDRLRETLAGCATPSALRALDRATAAIGWLDGIRAKGAPWPMPLPAIDAACGRIAEAASLLTTDGIAGNDARAAIDALDATLPAAQALLDLRAAPSTADAARDALSDAAAALLAPPAGGAQGERERARAASRVREACAAARRLEQSLAAEAPRDLKDSLRQLDRDARFAVRALPPALREICADPSRSGEPGNLSALERVTSIDLDRSRIVAMQSMIDGIGAIRPGAGRAFATQAKRMARLLTDPLKREQGQAAFASLEAQYGAAFPFAYEDELKRRTPRAVELTGGAPERLIERASALRAAWCEAVGNGDLGGVAARRLEQAARLCRSIRDLDQVIEPIDRAAGDRLATWGPWATRRAMVAPATQDLAARANLAARSFTAANTAEGVAAFERDLLALETAIPLVRLTAALERRLTPVLRGDPDTLGAQLAPLLATPGGNAYLAHEWRRFLTLHRAMIESEFARRSGEPAVRTALAEYLALLARDIEQAAFGAPKAIAPIPGFDGTAPTQEAPGSRSRTGSRTGSKTGSKSDPKPSGGDGGSRRDR